MRQAHSQAAREASISFASGRWDGPDNFTPAGVRFTTAEVAEALAVDLSASSFVEVDARAVSGLVTWIREHGSFFESSRMEWDDPRLWNTEGSRDDRSQFFAIGNAINFRFWRLQEALVIPSSGILRGEHLRGSMYMWRALRICLEEGRRPILDASFLASFSDSDFDAVFTDDRGENPLDPARSDRIRNLRDLGAVLLRAWRGRFFNLVQATGGSLVAFARLSRTFRAFDDPLYKLTMVNAILHSGSGIASFDADPLPGIDYHLLKQLLRHGLLRPRAELGAKLTARQLLSPLEGMELRRAALRVFVDVAQATAVGGDVLDNVWWGNKTNCTDLRPVCLDPLLVAQCPFHSVCARLTDFALPLEETRYY